MTLALNHLWGKGRASRARQRHNITSRGVIFA